MSSKMDEENSKLYEIYVQGNEKVSKMGEMDIQWDEEVSEWPYECYIGEVDSFVDGGTDEVI